ncbi:aldo/keto reductase [Paenibacillus cremeus]|uniref:Aldo/keto reductase n=1 Tax=Paenibacillus cremeus TaxID=2163881 RepID=A0A559K712_9BACL|nr:aldo/keto reductase [Paenibacillus cremeus]TVY07918.1 aldo/keto reductase [Paenibacillus cremeus]
MKHTVKLPDGTILPAIGQGTWNIGDSPSKRKQEIATLRLGIELGMKAIDTAEMYGEGLSETLVGEAISGIRDQVFLVSKVYPHNAGRDRLTRSCEQSLKRLKTDRLDLYLLHWRGRVPLSETVEEMERLIQAGKIVRWGVSNLDTDDMQELHAVSKGSHCAVNQVMYHLGSRGIEVDLLPWQRKHGILTMAYSPLAQAGSLRREMMHNQVVQSIAAEHGIGPFQLLLAWCIRSGDIMAVPKASNEEHVRQNASADQVELTDEDLRRLDAAFPSPKTKVPLDII